MAQAYTGERSHAAAIRGAFYNVSWTWHAVRQRGIAAEVRHITLVCTSVGRCGISPVPRVLPTIRIVGG